MEENISNAEYTNSQDETFDFLDFGEEETTPSQEQETKTEEQQPYGLRVKYNGEERDLGEAEAREFAQKGMNYDKLFERAENLQKQLEELQNSREFTVLDKFAKQAGLDRAQYMEQLEKEMQRQEVERLTDQGYSDEMAKEILETRRNMNAQNEELQRVKAQLEKYEKQSENTQKWAQFLKAHPEVEGFESLPDEVKAEIAGGAELESAYMRHENKTLKERLAALETNQKNAKAAPGSVSGDGAGEELDAFQRAMLAALEQ